ncbi:MAG: hypothetical protein JNK05_34880 [Myxococcales bacterium]|nr:hypothetical protein [Myxococcales bacterium]
MNGPTTRQPALSSTPTLSRVTVAQTNSILREHESGDFTRSAGLAELSKRSSDVSGALEQRLAGSMGLPFKLHEPNSTTNARGLRARIAERWASVFPSGSQRTMLQDRVMLGFACARITAAYDATVGEVVPYVERWHPSITRFDPTYGRWEAYTAEGWVVVLDELGRRGEGWIVSLVGDRLTSHLEGAIRALGGSYVGQEFAQRDSRRHSERMGQGIVEAMVPGGQAETDEAKRYTTALSKVGTNGLIVSPQYLAQGDDASASYGLKLHFPPDSGMKGLLALDATEASRLRLRILGQDTTSKDSTGGGYARAAVGAGVRQDLLEGDARALGEIASQLFDGWALLEARTRALFPKAEWCATPPEDEERKSRTRQSNATATSAIAAALPSIQAAADAAGLTLDVRRTLEEARPVFLENDDADA